MNAESQFPLPTDISLSNRGTKTSLLNNQIKYILTGFQLNKKCFDFEML